MWWRLSKIKRLCWGWQWPRSSKHSGSFLFIPDFQKKNQIITAMEFGISGKEMWFFVCVNLVCLFSTSTHVLIDQCILLIISRTLSYGVLWLSTGWVTRMPWVLGMAFLIVSVTMRSYSFLQTKPPSNSSFFQVSFRHCFPVYGLCSTMTVLARWTLYFPLFSSSIGKLHSRESTFWDGDAFPFEILISVIFSISPHHFCLVFSVLGHIAGSSILSPPTPFVETSQSCCFSSQVTLLPKCQSWVWLCA